jgi:hypothetical protein
MSSYVTTAQLKLFGIMPAEDIDALEALYPGIIAANVTGVSGLFDAGLIKRYAAPFQDPYPDALIWNVVQVVVGRLYLKRGYNPSSQQDQLIRKCHDDSLAWLREAADPDKGLVELPVKQATPGLAAAVNSGAPLAYGEASPYTAMDRQAAAVRAGCP